ncbi:phospholipase A [Pseudoduganella umbonata]|uniref:Phospholipase A1 n=1 Tax=Pseudoduganella umbonata TaxID=864828 RepID=A0A4P8HN06_9BURK|nr:phospholipase A [Pseudoduganella umbonata]MBB3219783.1 phospholipase A1 [Pseudoduganella umbonata]QCP09824.1 phospholipase [Pseudoduganella umbonata]
MKKHFSPCLSALLALSPCVVAAQTVPAAVDPALGRCSLLADPTERLGCYDALANRAQDPAPAVAAAPMPAPAAAASDQQQGAFPGGPVAKPVDANAPQAEQPVVSVQVPLWELDKDSKRGVFNFRPHRDNYLLLANYSNSTNNAPFNEVTPGGIDAKHVELAYQLSFKMKMLETIAGSPVDLWFGYTQQSFWQAYNRDESSPFRETNYQPEVMAIAPIGKRLLGFDFRYAGLGVVHQSNGQTATLSRSWNRAYAELGGEYGKLAVTARIWKRLDNSASDNDNLDITDFLGHGDLRLVYRDGGSEYSLLARRNLHTDHGALQLGWAVPLRANLKGYVQFFSGYGQSLIDYNYSQMSLGAGFLVGF